jgi:hypothetical protein
VPGEAEFSIHEAEFSIHEAQFSIQMGAARD